LQEDFFPPDVVPSQPDCKYHHWASGSLSWDEHKVTTEEQSCGSDLL